MNSAITEGHFYFMKELRGKITETDSKTVLARSWKKWDMGSSYSTGIKFQLCKMNTF